MSEHPTVTLAYDLTRDLDTATDMVKQCEQLFFLIETVTHHRKTLAADLNSLAGPIAVAYRMLDEATQLLESVNDPINKVRIDVHEQYIIDKREGKGND